MPNVNGSLVFAINPKDKEKCRKTEILLFHLIKNGIFLRGLLRYIVSENLSGVPASKVRAFSTFSVLTTKRKSTAFAYFQMARHSLSGSSKLISVQTFK
jgi:hypothetical protein